MSLARLILFAFAVIALLGCGRSRPVAPLVPIALPEDGGTAGNGFDSSWTDDYGVAARLNPSTSSPPGVLAATNRKTPSLDSSPGATTPPATSPPAMSPSTTSPPASRPQPYVANPIDVAKLTPTLEPIIVKISITKPDRKVVQGAGVVVSKDGVVLTTAALLKDAVAGEVEFCNQQKTLIKGHFPLQNLGEDELAAIIIDTHGHALEAASVDPMIAGRRTSANNNDPLLYFDTRRFPFSAIQLVVTGSQLSSRQSPGADGLTPKYTQLFFIPPPGTSPQGSPLFDRSGTLIALTLETPVGAELRALPVNEIAEQLPGFSLANATLYTDTPAPTPRPDMPATGTGPLAGDPPIESIAAPTAASSGSMSSVIRNGGPSVQVTNYRPLPSSQQFINFTMSPDARWAAVLSSGGKIYVYDLRFNKQVGVISTSQGEFLDAAFFSQGDKLATLRPRYSASDKPLSIWDLKTLSQLGSWEIDLDAQHLAISQDENVIALADSHGSAMSITFPGEIGDNFEKSPVLSHAEESAELTVMQIDPPSDNLILGFADGSITVIKMTSRLLKKLTGFKPHLVAIRGLSLSTDGKMLATCSDDGHIRIWEQWQTDFERRTVELRDNGAPIHDVVLGFDGRLAIGICGTSGAVLWDSSSRRVLDRFDTTPPPVKVVFSESASKFAIVSEDGRFSIWPIKGPGR